LEKIFEGIAVAISKKDFSKDCPLSAFPLGFSKKANCFVAPP